MPLALVTGATSGIGTETALQLAKQGFRVAVHGRDTSKVEALIARIREAGGEAIPVVADLASLTDIRAAFTAFAAAEPVLDVLVNNAGGMNATRTLTKDGFETTFGVNHLAPFLITHLLRANLEAAPAGRVVNVASRAHGRVPGLNLADLQAEQAWDGWKQYCHSKLMNILFTRELAKRFAGTRVTTNSLHPGVVATGFAGADGGWMGWVLMFLRPFLTKPGHGAATSVFLASAPEVAKVTGRYFSDCKEATPSAGAQDEAAAAALWATSARLCGIEA